MTEAKPETATKQGRSSATDDPWATVPDTPALIPFLTAAQRADVVNGRAVLQVTGMEYDAHGTYGARFVATFLAPDGNAYKYAFKANRGTTPRDVINKWIWTKINQEKVNPVPVVMCKRGNAYFFDRPGSESERDQSEAAPSTAADFDVPDF